jgi:enoyl-CoA hydratase/carnithine racemase
MTGPETQLDDVAVKVERSEGVLVITRNRPKQKNAIDTSMSLGLLGAVENLWRDARVLRIYGGANEVLKEIVGHAVVGS